MRIVQLSGLGCGFTEAVLVHSHAARRRYGRFTVGTSMLAMVHSASRSIKGGLLHIVTMSMITLDSHVLPYLCTSCSSQRDDHLVQRIFMVMLSVTMEESTVNH